MCCLERACDIQIAALSGNATPRLALPAVAARVAQQFKGLPNKAEKTEWKALLRMPDRTDPTYCS